MRSGFFVLFLWAGQSEFMALGMVFNTLLAMRFPDILNALNV